jgi:hypothetical protein
MSVSALFVAILYNHGLIDPRSSNRARFRHARSSVSCTEGPGQSLDAAIEQLAPVIETFKISGHVRNVRR